jgi:hypothetical protein
MPLLETPLGGDSRERRRLLREAQRTVASHVFTTMHGLPHNAPTSTPDWPELRAPDFEERVAAIMRDGYARVWERLASNGRRP